MLNLFSMVNVFRYDDVATVLRHPLTSADDRNSALHQSLCAGDKLTTGYLSQMNDRSFLRRDPPEHTRLRRLAAKGFTSRRVEALRPLIQRTVDDALDNVGNQLELVEELAYPLPIVVICELLGIPDEDRAFVATWPRTQLCCTFERASSYAARQIKEPEPGNDGQADADRFESQLTDYFAYLIERRRGNPGDDLTSALIAAAEHGEQLTADEINATLRL